MASPDLSVSVLMPVHSGVESLHLAAALDSLLNQTSEPDEVVIVEDGPLPDGHLEVLTRFEAKHSRVVRVRLETNHGAGVANQAGLEAATCAWIAKADADDVNLPGRIGSQLEAVIREGADVCGSAMLEFVDREDNIVSARSMPCSHRDIGARLRWNNPINHPTAFYRRETALGAGGYPPWRYMQDYALIARMYTQGARLMNMEDVLVLFRASKNVTKRRRSATVRRLEWDLQRELHRLGIVNKPMILINLAWRTAFRLLPPHAVRMISRNVLARSLTKATPAE